MTRTTDRLPVTLAPYQRLYGDIEALAAEFGGQFNWQPSAGEVADRLRALLSRYRVVTSVNGEQRLAVPEDFEGAPGWRSVEGDRAWWGMPYVASVEE